MAEIDEEKAKRMIAETGPNVKYNKTLGPWYPQKRKDIAVFERNVEDGGNFERIVWYIAYNNGHKTLIEKLYDTGNIQIDDPGHNFFTKKCQTISAETDYGFITVNIRGGVLRKKLSIMGIPD